MKVKVDLSDLHAQTTEAIRAMKTSGFRMHQILDEAAAELRADHAYDNYSHNLENSTVAGPLIESDDSSQVSFGAGMYYASIVESRGRQDVEGKVVEVTGTIQVTFDADAEDIGSM